MDAFVRHKCETEILNIAKDLIASFGFNIHILSDVATAGGIIESWKLQGNNEHEVTLIAAIISQLLIKTPPTIKALEKIHKENLKQEAKGKRTTVSKIKEQLIEGQKVNILLPTAIAYFEADFKLIKHKSNFYQLLLKYLPAEKISTNLFFDDAATGNDAFVERADFHKYILTTNKLPDQVIENAVIEVVSPVLKSGTYKWKGIYNEKAVGFTMKDEEYLKSVIKREVSFQSGFSFQCILKVSRIIDDFGKIRLRNYTVVTVLGKMQDDNKVVETEQGKRYKKVKEDELNQLSLF